MKKICFSAYILMLITACQNSVSISEVLLPTSVTPSPQQIKYHHLETIGFIHFTINTFTGKEWGYGDESPSLFNPTQLNAEQWVIAAKDAGLKELILTTKHHDGFCLWPSKFTEHSVRKSPYKNGTGDVVREFVDACRKYDIKIGFYLSPWDRNHKDYGRQEYIDYYKNQITELLTQYGEINEMWFDGANGGDGYYGGAREKRVIDRETYYPWDTLFNIVKKLQPDILIFSDAGPDIRWVGNEQGFAGETFWSAISDTSLIIGGSDAAYLNRGDPNGNKWLIGQCDVSIRPGWFYHQEQDSLVKSPLELVDIYYKSVGRNGVLLLNLPPDKRGLIHEKDVESLQKYKSIIDETFKTNLASRKEVSVSNVISLSHALTSHTVDGDPLTYWAPASDANAGELIINLGTETEFDLIMLQEPIQLGQRINQFTVSVMDKENNWTDVAHGTTIGYKRLVRIQPVRANKIKIGFSAPTTTPAIGEIGIFLASSGEPVMIN